MSPRRPSANVDMDRFMRRIDAKIDQTLGALLPEITALKVAVLRGEMKQDVFSQRLADLEMQVIESRQHLQITERAGAQAAQALSETALDTAANLAKVAPRNVWRTKFGMITAGSAAFVAIVAFFNNLPQFVRGTSEVVVKVFAYIVSKK